MIADAFPNVINMQDPVHHLHNTCKDIARLPAFTQVSIMSVPCNTSVFLPKISIIIKVIDITKSLIKHFSHSVHASSQLRLVMSELKITRGLQKIGKTRFATIYYSCLSLLECLPAITAAVERNLIDLSTVSAFICAYMHSDYHGILTICTAYGYRSIKNESFPRAPVPCFGSVWS